MFKSSITDQQKGTQAIEPSKQISFLVNNSLNTMGLHEINKDGSWGDDDDARKQQQPWSNEVYYMKQENASNNTALHETDVDALWENGYDIRKRSEPWSEETYVQQSKAPFSVPYAKAQAWSSDIYEVSGLEANQEKSPSHHTRRNICLALLALAIVGGVIGALAAMGIMTGSNSSGSSSELVPVGGSATNLTTIANTTTALMTYTTLQNFTTVMQAISNATTLSTLASSLATTTQTTTFFSTVTQATSQLASTVQSTTSQLLTSLASTLAPTATLTTPSTTATLTAELPTLSVSNSTGYQDEGIPVFVSASILNASGTETLSITATAPLWLGTFNQGNFNSSANTWTFTPEQLSGLAFAPNLPNNLNAAQTISWTATATQSNASGNSVVANSTITINGIPFAATAMILPRVNGNVGQSLTATFSSTYPSNALGQTNTYIISATSLPVGSTLTGTDILFAGGIYATRVPNPTVTLNSPTAGTFNIPVTAVGTENGQTAELTKNWAILFCAPGRCWSAGDGLCIVAQGGNLQFCT